MADDSFKKLLVKLGISTAEWKQTVKGIKTELKEMQDQALKDFRARQDAVQKELDLTKQQIADQKNLKSQAEAMAAVDKAKAVWSDQQAAATKAKLADVKLETAEIKKQTTESANLVRQEQDKVRLKQLQLTVEKQQTAEIERQRKAEASVPSTAGVSQVRTTVAASTQSDVIQKIQTVAMREVVEQERQKLATQEAQLRVLSQQEGIRRADVAVVEKEVAQERARLALLENQLRMRESEEKQIRLQQERSARIPNAAGVAGLRTTMQSATSVQLSKEQTAEIEKGIGQERAKLAVQEAQLKIMSQQEGARKADIEILEKEIGQERAKLALQESQLRMSKSQQPAQPSGGGEGGGGFLSGALLSIGGGLFGTGLTGMMATGVAAGELLEKALEKAAEKVRELGHEMLEATGPAGQLREQFDKLAQRANVNPDEFLNKLRVATRGLVEDNTQLIKVANQFMSGPLQMEPEQIVKLTGLTVALARATARGPDSVETAMQALSRAALTGNVRMLSMAVGIDNTQLKLQGLGNAMQTVTGRQVQLSVIMDAMTRRFAEVGTPMTTLKDLFSQVHMVQGAFLEDMAYSITHSKEFAAAIETVSKWLMNATPMILDFAKSLGEKVGVAFAYLKPLITEFWRGLTSAWTIVEQLATGLGKLSGAMLSLGGASEATSKKLSSFGKIAHLITEAFAPVVLSLEEVASAMTLVNDLVDAATSHSMSKAEQAWKAAEARNKQAIQSFKDTFKTPEAPKTGEVEIGPAPPPSKVPTQEQANVAKQIAAVNLKIKEDEEKRKLDIRLQAIEEEKNVNKAAYDSGLISLQDFVSKEQAILQKEHAAKLAMIHADADARRAALNQESKGMTYKDSAGKVTTLPGMDPGLKAAKQKEIASSENAQVEAENLRAGKEENANQKQILQDQIAARKEYVNAINKIEQDGVKERIRILDEEFKQGVGTADQYLAQKKALIEEEFQLQVQSLSQQAAANKDNAQELAKIRIQFVEDEMSKEKQLQELEEHEGEIRLESIKTRYSQAKEILEAQTAQAQQPGSPTEGQATATITAEQQLTTAYLQRLQTEQTRLEQSGKAFTSEWVGINKEISSAVQEQIKLNTELAKAKDVAGPLGQIFGTIASEFGSLLGTKTKGTLDQLAKSLETLSKVQTGVAAQTGGLGGLFKSTASSFTGLFKHDDNSGAQKAVQTAQQIFEEGLKSAATKVTDFATGAVAAATKLGAGFDTTNQKFGSSIDVVIQQLNSFATALANAHPGGSPAAPSEESPDADSDTAPTGDSGLVGSVPGISGTPSSDSAVGGVTSDITGGLTTFSAALAKAADSGGNFAEKLQAFAGKMGGIIQSIGAVASNILGAKTAGGGAFSGALSAGSFGLQVGGPLGAAIGAAVGGIMGGLVGNKQQQLQEQLAGITTHLQGIEDNLKNGTVSLGASITQLEGLRSSTVATLGGSKKGSKALPAALQSINDELTNLLAQQKSTLDDLHAQLATLEEPTSFQPIIDNLDQIIQKYQTYASAAVGNTQEVTNANEYLVESLKSYAQTLSTQVNTAEQQAIQNKIQLIDLQQQQFQATAQYEQQIYDIQTSGVTTRQRTTAMSKGEEMAQATYQYDQQNQQLQAEINVTQMKVTAEQQIFDLASTRVDLENQLLQAQSVQETLSVQNIQALQQTLNQLSSALGPGGTLPSGLLNATGGVDVQAIEQLLGLPITSVTGSAPGTPALNNMPPIYQEFLDVFNKNPSTSGFASQLLSAAATPFGSSQRQSLDNQLRSNPQFGQELVAAGVVSKPVNGQSLDPNWLNFFGWIMNQATATTPTTSGGGGQEPTLPTPAAPQLLAGGQIEQTGAAVVHAGEGVFSAQAVPIFQQMINAMQQFSNTLLNFLPGFSGMNNQAIRPMAPITSPSTAAAGAPMLDEGGEVEGTGAAVVHAGEGIFSSAAVPVFQQMVDGMNKFGAIILGWTQKIGTGAANMGTGVTLRPGSGVMNNPLASGAASSSKAPLEMHQTMFDLSKARVTLETTLLTQQKQVIALDMQRIQALQTLAANSSSGSVQSLEGAFAKVYELRGRQGAGGFTKENL